MDRALPAAVRDAVGAKTDDNAEFSLPLFLPMADDGCPVYDPASLADEGPPKILAKVAIDDVPTGAFVVQLPRPTLERMGNGELAAGAWVIFTPSETTDFVASGSDRTPRLLVAKAGAFNATKARWTFGLPRLRKDKVNILYRSHVAPSSETPRAADVMVVGRAIGVFVDGVLRKLGKS